MQCRNLYPGRLSSIALLIGLVLMVLVDWFKNGAASIWIQTRGCRPIRHSGCRAGPHATAPGCKRRSRDSRLPSRGPAIAARTPSRLHLRLACAAASGKPADSSGRGSRQILRAEETSGQALQEAGGRVLQEASGDTSSPRLPAVQVEGKKFRMLSNWQREYTMEHTLTQLKEMAFPIASAIQQFDLFCITWCNL
uniref:Uncharacterized protein n=1 Tax=Setaria italica TaxID=4555 RepID=K3ZX50_SETIT